MTIILIIIFITRKFSELITSKSHSHISYFHKLLAPFNFRFTANSVVIHFPNIDSLWDAARRDILIVC